MQEATTLHGVNEGIFQCLQLDFKSYFPGRGHLEENNGGCLGKTSWSCGNYNSQGDGAEENQRLPQGPDFFLLAHDVLSTTDGSQSLASGVPGVAGFPPA